MDYISICLITPTLYFSCFTCFNWGFGFKVTSCLPSTTLSFQQPLYSHMAPTAHYGQGWVHVLLRISPETKAFQHLTTATLAEFLPNQLGVTECWLSKYHVRFFNSWVYLNIFPTFLAYRPVSYPTTAVGCCYCERLCMHSYKLLENMPVLYIYILWSFWNQKLLYFSIDIPHDTFY